MYSKQLKVIPYVLIMILMFTTKEAFSAYVEILDTTDANGYNSDSTFLVSANGVIAQHGIAYTSNGSGFFHYSFDDVKMAYQGNYGNMSYGGFPTSTCFVIKKSDSTYSKVQIISRLASNQYIYELGANAAPNDRMLERSDYDRSIRYKPNNAYFHYRYLAYDTLFWDPPLPNNNHLLGYAIYRTKIGAFIDTSAQINLAQWDSVAFVDSSKRSGIVNPIDQFYQNIVAVYSEGNSDFLQGWTHFVPAVGAKDFGMVSEKLGNRISIRETAQGCSVELQSLSRRSSNISLAIYNVTGQQLSRFANISSNHVFLNATDWNFTRGLYIVKAEFPDKSILNQKFMFSR